MVGLCVGVDDYQHMPTLNNAARDADAVARALRGVTGCYSEAIRNPTTATELRCARACGSPSSPSSSLWSTMLATGSSSTAKCG